MQSSSGGDTDDIRATFDEMPVLSFLVVRKIDECERFVGRSKESQDGQGSDQGFTAGSGEQFLGKIRSGNKNKRVAMKRVETKRGKIPLMLVAPHGNRDDDINTDIITEVMSRELGCYHVINQGWRRVAKAVLGENYANLNDLAHCKLGPVRREFLDPILSYKDDMINRFGRCAILYIHGMANDVRQRVKDNVDIVVGYGNGEPPSYLCSEQFKVALISNLAKENFNVYQAAAGSKFSAWKSDNLAQLFRKHHVDKRVQSIQLEIINVRRYELSVAVETAMAMSLAVERFMDGKNKSMSSPIKEFN